MNVIKKMIGFTPAVPGVALRKAWERAVGVSKGYVLVMTMMIVAATMILVMSVAQKATGYKSLGRYAYDREKAKVLALSGVQIALAQLDTIMTGSDESKQMSSLLMLVDCKQTFTLKEEIDGINGECAITLGSEQGKININRLYDFKEKKFIGGTLNPSTGSLLRQGYGGQAGRADNQGAPPGAGGGSAVPIDGKKILQLICEKLQAQIKEKELFGRIERFLKERKEPLVDVTELIEVMQFKKGTDGAQMLRNIFTVFTQDTLLQPLILAPAVGKLFGFKQWTEKEDKRKKQVEELSKKLKPTLDWAKEWNGILGGIYGKEYASLSQELRTLFNGKFESNVLSVLSYGTYNSVTQKIYAILEKEASQEKDAPVVYHVRRVYWL